MSLKATFSRWILFLLLTYVFAQDPSTNLPQGRIVGTKVYTDNSIVEVFFGIPYATPPTGRYRFSAPERHSGWRRTFFAHRVPPQCPQLHDDGDNLNISEDCLFLNIWTPRRADGNSLPVAVILYSESWTKGGVHLHCQELAAEGIVVVTVAYRLHMLSFFTLRSMTARGNLALLDQYLALLWLRDNISAFGGDPTAITLVGHSAGADSVLYHIASPRSVGLFRRAILMSPQYIWKTLDKNLIHGNATERISREMAQALRCYSNIDQEILNCLRTKTLTEIMTLFSNTNWTKDMQPIPDTFLPDNEQYLPGTLPALTGGKQPMPLDLLFGTASLEAINSYEQNFEDVAKRGLPYISEYITSRAIPEMLQMFEFNKSPEALPMLIQAVRWEYWGSISRNGGARDVAAAVEALGRMQSAARWGAAGALLAARLARRVARLYVYRYARAAGADLRGRQHNFTGAVHGTDLVALLGDAQMLHIARRHQTEEEKRESMQFRGYMTNFIKFGAPARDEEWQRYRAGEAYVNDLRFEDNVSPYTQGARKDAAFWLQYLPNLSNMLVSGQHTEHLMNENGDNRLRGGVFAMCGVSVVLLALLLLCAILLHKQRTQRTDTEESHL